MSKGWRNGILLVLLCGCTPVSFRDQPETLEPAFDQECWPLANGEWSVKIDSPIGVFIGRAWTTGALDQSWQQTQFEMRLPSGPFQGQLMESFDPARKRSYMFWTDSRQKAPLLWWGESSEDKTSILFRSTVESEVGHSASYRMRRQPISKDRQSVMIWVDEQSTEPTYTILLERQSPK